MASREAGVNGPCEESISGAERNKKKADKDIIGLLQARLTAGRQAPPR
ncbi:hypothetical protein HMPREF0484_4532 [Klebsiella pneumoniae subsp. rhinoscleromatis ATCC 13884]|nr:hypothetical protein HMPREF0484_4532 [Klebsiella pneumoniae subsp. rhinoscleromatis ATCC 13884]EOY65232.1 hypothetical protein H253_2917 [Klebsiella pneumoniae KP-7]EOZ78386.1 hypothetical protein H254_2009 [Klebsiella pneumoniae KP-11]